MKNTINKMIKVARKSEHKARFRKVAGIGLVAGALITTFGMSNVALAEEVTTASTTTVEAGADPVVAEVTEATSPVVTEATPVVSTEPVAVESATTATISTTTETNGLSPSDAGRYSYTVNTTMTGEVKEGDYVEYKLTNLPHAGLDGKSVSISDGTVIGTLSKVSDVSNRTLEMNGTDTQKQAVEVSSYDSIYRVVFHNTVENLQDISYSFGLVNGNNVWTYVSENSPITSTISANGVEVASKTTTIKALSQETQNTSALYQSSSQATYTTTGIAGTRFNHNVRNSNEVTINAGDLLTSTLGDNAGIVFDTSSVTVGQVFTIQDVGSNNALTTVNDNGVLLFDNSKYRFEVVSISENSVTYRALDSFQAVDGRYGGLPLKFVVTDEAIVDLANNRLNIPSYTSTVTSSDGSVKSTLTEAVTIPISGATIFASALTIPRSNVNVVYVSDTGEVLEAQSSVLSQAKVGTAYSTVAKTFKDYDLIAVPDNSSGKTTLEDTLVTYVYKKKVGSVFEDNYIQGTSTKLTDTITVLSGVSVGTSYDSSSQDEVITLSNGQSYQLTKKADNSVGTVIEGATYLKNYYTEIKGSVVVHYVDMDGNTIKEPVVDTEETSTGVAYDTTDNKPSMILLSSDGHVKTYLFNKVDEASQEVGTVVKGETVVTYVYEEIELLPIKDVLNKNGQSIDGEKVLVGDVLTFVLDGDAVLDNVDGGLWQYDLTDLIDTKKLEFVNGSVKVKAGEFANITLSDGRVLTANDDISEYVTIEYNDGLLAIRPTKEFYAILKENDVVDLVDIDAQFEAIVISDGKIENTFIQIVNGFEFVSNTTQNEVEQPVVPEPVKQEPTAPKQEAPALPNTGQSSSLGLTFVGIVALFVSLFGLRKKNEK
ncbi:TPA: MucBP domain-containing protein [Streptococcus suis]|nr:MucBP domain-containing protein [Streptococcus suis]